MSATFKASCIKSHTASFYDFVYTALNFYISASSFAVFQCVLDKKNRQQNKQTKDIKGRQNNIVPVNYMFGKMFYETLLHFQSHTSLPFFLSSEILQKRKTATLFCCSGSWDQGLAFKGIQSLKGTLSAACLS